jgi:hypothetical protein
MLVAPPHSSMIALIGISRDLDDAAYPAALSPFLGAPLLHYQAQLAQRAGAHTVYFLCEQFHHGAVQSVDRLRLLGLDAHIIRSFDEITEIGARQLLLIADGVVMDPAWIGEVAANHKPVRSAQVFTIANDVNAPALEPIDLERQWSGIAIIDGQSLRLPTTVPDGWDPLSVLFRQVMAVQPDFHHWDTARCDALALTRLTRQSAIASTEQRLIARMTRDAKAMPLQQLFARRTGQLLMAMVHQQRAGAMLAAAAGLSFVLALVLAFFGQPVLSLLTGMMIFTCSYLWQSLSRISPRSRGGSDMASGAAVAALLLIAHINLAATTWPGLAWAKIILSLASLLLLAIGQEIAITAKAGSGWRWALDPLVLWMALTLMTLGSGIGIALNLLGAYVVAVVAACAWRLRPND